jgi:hypothetical protein
MSTEMATERLRLRLWQLADAERLHNLWAERDPRSLHVIRLCGRTGGAEPGVTSADDGRGSVGDLQFGQNVRHVVAYRFSAERGLSGDGRVGPSRSDQVENVMCQWRIIADQEPLPGRTSEAGDQRGTRLALTKLARSAMQLCFLQERRYWPYTKWFSMAFSELDAAQELGAELDRLLGSSNPAQGIAALVTVLEHLAGRQNNLQIARALDPRCRPFEVGINQAVRPYLVLNAARFAQACAEQIGDSRLRRLPTVGGIDQLTHAGDLLVNFTSWPTALIKVYEQQLNITGESR